MAWGRPADAMPQGRRGSGLGRVVVIGLIVLAVVFLIWYVDAHNASTVPTLGAGQVPPTPDLTQIGSGDWLDRLVFGLLDWARIRLLPVSLLWALAGVIVHYWPGAQGHAYRMWFAVCVGLFAVVVVFPVLEVKLPDLEAWVTHTAGTSTVVCTVPPPTPR